MRKTKEVKLCQPPQHLKVHLIVRMIFPVKGNCLYKVRCKAIGIGSIWFAYVSYAFCFILLYHSFLYVSSYILGKFKLH